MNQVRLGPAFWPRAGGYKLASSRLQLRSAPRVIDESFADDDALAVARRDSSQCLLTLPATVRRGCGVQAAAMQVLAVVRLEDSTPSAVMASEELSDRVMHFFCTRNHVVNSRCSWLILLEMPI